MLSRPGPVPSGSGWSFEVKWDGFRALVSTEDGLRVRSRGWNMTELLPELRFLPAGLPPRPGPRHDDPVDVRHLRRAAGHGEEIVSAPFSERRAARRGWVKTKNPNYWRLDLQRDAMQRSRERRRNNSSRRLGC